MQFLNCGVVFDAGSRSYLACATGARTWLSRCPCMQGPSLGFHGGILGISLVAPYLYLVLRLAKVRSSGSSTTTPTQSSLDRPVKKGGNTPMTLCYSAQPGLATQDGLTARVGTKGNGGKGSTRSRTSVCVCVRRTGVLLIHGEASRSHGAAGWEF